MTARLPAFSGTLLSTLALGLSACGGDGASLRFTANERAVSTSSAWINAAAESPPVPSTVFQSSDGTAFTLTQARIHLRDIRLDLPKGTKCGEVSGLLEGAECKGGDSSGTIQVPGPIVVDLLTGTTTPDLSGLRIPAGNYKRIDFRLEEAKSDEVGATEPLLGYSFLARADFTQDGVARKLEMLFKFSEDARFESSTGVDVPEGGSLVAFLKPQVWLEGLPLGECIQDGDVEVANDTVRIDGKSGGKCSDAESTVKSNIKRSGDLRKSDEG
ncbi:DUF4382 domain-containing protein [Pyxidicoccus xibeiensis]|uniref:DUF4382 domain-containing protein n=1 Tax=Pyxidicoccus xibeiensis TaxID=2906759 RepID=UPI0020A71C24|nr:DUF4382 domain-containing protein [Pyxidicoccus xibeiensis]MCP3137100.1 DUF4382 domain-containing protein [Pyxidicoccus xibeiensis]